MKISVLSVGKMKDPGLRALSEIYRERLSHHLPVEDLEVGKEKRGTPAKVVGQEGEALLGAVAPGALVIAMTEEGKNLSSVEVAEKMQEWMVEGRQEVAFLIGGAHGLSREVKRASDMKWSLSAMTFPHDVARMLLWEQLYRAMTIIRGEPYHK